MGIAVPPLGLQDADGRITGGVGCDPVTPQFPAPQSGPASTDSTTTIPYAPTYHATVDSPKATYSASQLLFTPAATPTDVFTITGSASKTIRVTRIEVTGLATTAGTVDVALV